MTNQPDWMIWRKAAIAKGWRGWNTKALRTDPVGQVEAAKAYLKSHNIIVAALPDGTFLTRQTTSHYTHVIVGFVRHNPDSCGAWYVIQWTAVNPHGKARREAKRTMGKHDPRLLYQSVKAIPVY